MSDDTAGGGSGRPPWYGNLGSVPVLRHQDLDAAEVVRAADFDSGLHAESDRWFVLVDERGMPVGAVGPERAEPSIVIVADADLPVGVALAAGAFDDAQPDTGVVVIEHRSRRVLGVWSGTPLTLAMQQRVGFVRISALPGSPDIPYIVHSCKCVDDGVTCDTMTTFERKPAVMPPCANGNQLAAHDFVW